MRIAPLLLLLIALLPATALALKVRDGDLLFVTAAHTGLSGAIDDATGVRGQASFDHIALVAHAGDAAVVLHADEHGSREQPLQAFIDEATAKQRQIVVYRLSRAHRPAIPDAIAQARRMLGKPYNETYVQDDNSYYCSDFIERAFRAHHVFALQPMNFRTCRPARSHRTGPISIAARACPCHRTCRAATRTIWPRHPG